MLEKLIKDFLRELQATGRSKKTVEAYGYHLEKFARFCEENGYDFHAINGKESRVFRNQWEAKACKHKRHHYGGALTFGSRESKGNSVVSRLRNEGKAALIPYQTEKDTVLPRQSAVSCCLGF